MIRKLKNFAHKILAIIANIQYGFPSKKLFIIGVTGTDGKTTTTSLIHHILKSADKKVAMVTTIGAVINNKTYDTGFHVTTPSSFSLQKYIKKALDQKVEYLVLEITSHALDQHRAYGINFDIGVLTNITHEHLDYHKTYENYLKAKAKLFQKAPVAILNKDDQSFEKISKLIPNKRIIAYSLSKEAEFNLKKFPFKTKLSGDYNLQNCLAAIAATKQLGISDQIIKKALLTFNPPSGRQNIIYNKSFKVIVDFAHTPNAFEQLLKSFKNRNGRLIHVFGSAGERDFSKRPTMGEASAKYADIIILTSEDPRSEKISDINNQIKKDIGKKFDKDTLVEIEDRQKAINYAIQIAKKGDIVLLTGKGHEKSINLGSGEIPWDEQKAVQKALKMKGG